METTQLLIPPAINPMLRRLAKISDMDIDHSTAKGTLLKSLFFMAMIASGAAISLICTTSLPLLITAAASFFISPVLAVFVKKAAGIFGALSGLATGYIMAFLCKILPDRGMLLLLAFIVTFSVILALQIIYFTKKFHSDNAKRNVICASAASIVLSAALILLCMLIPEFSVFVKTNILLVVIGSAALAVGSAALLVMDMDCALYSAEDRYLPRIYEWQIAYALAMNVVFLYYEIFAYFLGGDSIKQPNVTQVITCNLCQ